MPFCSAILFFSQVITLKVCSSGLNLIPIPNVISNLEKYIFQLIPDITKINDFPEVINDESIADYFNFDDIDRENIQNLHKKDYSFKYIIS